MERPQEKGRTRRAVCVAGGTGATLALLGACGAPGGATTPAVQPGTRAAELRLHVRAGSEADTLDQRLPELTQKYPGLSVTIEPFPGGEYLTKIVSLMAASSLGDAFWGGNAQSQSSKWAHLGGVSPLDQIVRADKFDLAQYYRQAVDGGRLDGKLYGLPFKLHPSFCGLYFNANAVQDLGQRPPDATSTWEQVLDLARRLKRADGGSVARWGLLVPVPGQAAQFWITWARSWGAELYSPDGKKALLDDPKFLAAVQFMHDLAFKHQVAPDFAQLNAIRGAGTGFEEGFGALMQGSSSQKSMPTRIQGKFQVGNFLWPKGPAGQRGSIAISDYIHVAKQSPFQAEAWALTKHLCDMETGIRLGEGTGGASGTCGARPDVYRHERILANPLHRAWLEAVEQVMPFREPWNFRGQDVEDQVLKPNFDKLWKGEETPGPGFLKQMSTQVQQILDQPRGA
ncbi:MAG: extracellular solute-binding protein [Chloroflexota bacterium]|nr:extracellular solute-binding protein [Chloroflexota bacterium]